MDIVANSTITLENKNGQKHEAMRRWICTACFFVISFNAVLPIRWLVSTSIDNVINMFACLIICGVYFERGTLSLSKKALFLLLADMLLGVLMVVIGIRFSVLGYISYGIFYCFFAALIILETKNAKQIENMMISGSMGVMISFLVLFIVSAFFSQLTSEQYSAVTGNPNAIGIFSAWAFCGATYIAKKKERYHKYFAIFIQGIALGFIIFSRSRTALLIPMGIVAFLLITFIVNRDKRKSFLNIIKAFVMILLSFAISYVAVTSFHQTFGFSPKSDTAIALKNTFDVTFEQNKYGDAQIGIGDVISQSGKRSVKGLGDGNSFTSGRILVWQTFVKELNLSGHQSGLLEVNKIKNYNAHNGYIQVAYSFGVVTGAVYIAITILMLASAIGLFYRFIRKRKQTVEAAYAVIIIYCCFISSMLSADVSPYQCYFVLLLNFCAIPFVCLETESNRSKISGVQ